MSLINLQAALFVFAGVCLLIVAIAWVRRWRSKRRAWHRRHMVDRRFTPDSRDWQGHFEQYERPSILRRQAE